MASNDNPRYDIDVNRVICSMLPILFILAALDASGGDLRCDGRIASVGDRKFEVLAKCGQPAYRDVRYEKRIQRDFFRDLFPPGEKTERERLREPLLVEEIVEIEEWVYNLGPLRFLRYLRFENGILVEIETGDYGY